MNEEKEQKEEKWNAERHAAGMGWHERLDLEATTHLNRNPSCNKYMSRTNESEEVVRRREIKGPKNKHEVKA